jgi:hypothetical protein
MAADQKTDDNQGRSPNATGPVARAVEQRTAGTFGANDDHYDSHNGIAHILPSKGQKGDQAR